MMIIEHPARDIPERRFFDYRKNEFITIPAIHLDPVRLQLEHSLMSMRRYEAKMHKPFSSSERLSGDDLMEYIKCMAVTQPKNENMYSQLTTAALLQISEYIQDANSAWEIRGPSEYEKSQQRRKMPNTVEAIYYAMIQYGIPFECEKWHLNSLMALIDYCYRKGGGGGGRTRTQKEWNEFYRSMNEANRKKYHSKG